MVTIMLKWILLDIKRTLKSRKAYLLFTILSISMVYFIYTFNGNNLNSEDDYDLSDEEVAFQITLSVHFNEIYNLDNNFDERCHLFTNEELAEMPDFDYKEICHGYEVLSAHRSKMLTALGDQDSKEFYRYKMFILDVATDGFFDYLDNLDAKSKAITVNRMISRDQLLKIKADIKAQTSDIETFEMEDLFNHNILIFNQRAQKLIEAYNHYQNDYPIEVDFRINAGFFLVNYLDQNFTLLIFIGILLIFDSFYRDYQTGVIKTMLSAPTKRYSYIILKLISTLISSLILTALPLVIFSLYLYFKNGYFGLNYPISLTQGSLSGFKPHLTYSRIVGEEKPANLFSTYTNICRVGPISQFSTDSLKGGIGTMIDCQEFIPYHALKIIMLSEYLRLILIYYLLIFIFLSSLNSLLSLVFNNRIYNLVILTSILGLGMILNIVLLGSPLLKFLPTTFLSPTKLLMMTVPYTYLNGLVTLSFYTLVLSTITYLILQKKDFTY